MILSLVRFPHPSWAIKHRCMLLLSLHKCLVSSQCNSLIIFSLNTWGNDPPLEPVRMEFCSQESCIPSGVVGFYILRASLGPPRHNPIKYFAEHRNLQCRFPDILYLNREIPINCTYSVYFTTYLRLFMG